MKQKIQQTKKQKFTTLLGIKYIDRVDDPLNRFPTVKVINRTVTLFTYMIGKVLLMMKLEEIKNSVTLHC